VGDRVRRLLRNDDADAVAAHDAAVGQRVRELVREHVEVVKRVRLRAPRGSLEQRDRSPRVVVLAQTVACDVVVVGDIVPRERRPRLLVSLVVEPDVPGHL